MGEECTEVIIGGRKEDKEETIYEIADLTYHVMVLMVQMGIPWRTSPGSWRSATWWTTR